LSISLIKVLGGSSSQSRVETSMKIMCLESGFIGEEAFMNQDGLMELMPN